jgi:hypothetical protein
MGEFETTRVTPHRRLVLASTRGRSIIGSIPVQ